MAIEGKKMDELTVLAFRRSYWSFWNMWLLLAIGLFLLLAPSAATDLLGHYAPIDSIIETVDLTMWIGGIVLTLWAICNIAYQRIYSSYTLYEDRIEAAHGILRRRISSAELAHIRSVDINKTLMGMILDYGDLLLGTAGTGENNVILQGLDCPSKVKERIRELQHRQLHSPAQKPAVASGPTLQQSVPPSRTDVFPQEQPVPQPQQTVPATPLAESEQGDKRMEDSDFGLANGQPPLSEPDMPQNNPYRSHPSRHRELHNMSPEELNEELERRIRSAAK